MSYLNPPYENNFKELCAAMPLFYLDVREMRAVLRAQGYLLDGVCDGMEQLVDVNFILTADEPTIRLWETALKITYKRKLTLDQRRHVVIGYIIGFGHIGEPEIRSIIAQYTPNEVTFDFWRGHIGIMIEGEIFDEDNLLDSLLRRIPAHLGLGITIHIRREFRRTLPIAQTGIVGAYYKYDPESLDHMEVKRPLPVGQAGVVGSYQHFEPESLDHMLASQDVSVAQMGLVTSASAFEPESMERKSSSRDILVARAASEEGRLYGSLPEVKKSATEVLDVRRAAFEKPSLTGAFPDAKREGTQRARGAGGVFYQTRVTSKLIE